MSGKMLMFEMNSLMLALSVDRAVAPLDVEIVPVARKNYNKPLEELLDPWSEIYDEDAENEDYTGAPLGGTMLVLCELEDKLDEVLSALRGAGVGADCLKAVLTQHNREWDAVKLYNELRRERQEMTGK
ncbi:MAG: DUF3783 domain-containing protein [Ruminococcaceae bacterium]|nr:DUF3783 domain-containing protein [Oscillospiraceae bacterium]